jgi:hypothetical protein
MSQLRSLCISPHGLRSKEIVLWYGAKPGSRMLLQEQDSLTGDWQTKKT